jgi:hypothetical protein
MRLFMLFWLLLRLLSSELFWHGFHVEHPDGIAWMTALNKDLKLTVWKLLDAKLHRPAQLENDDDDDDDIKQSLPLSTWHHIVETFRQSRSSLIQLLDPTQNVDEAQKSKELPYACDMLVVLTRICVSGSQKELLRDTSLAIALTRQSFGNIHYYVLHYLVDFIFYNLQIQ